MEDGDYNKDIKKRAVRAAQKGADGEKREESVPGVTAGE